MNWGKIAKGALNVGMSMLNEAGKQVEERKKTKEEYQYYDDYKLVEIIKKNKTHWRAVTAFSILKERGYDADEIKRMID